MLQASFQSFQSFDPAAAQALQKVACMAGQDLAGLLQLEGLPLDTSREAYVQHAVLRVCVEDVQWQSASFAQVRIQHVSSSSASCSFTSMSFWHLQPLDFFVLLRLHCTALTRGSLACGCGFTMPAWHTGVPCLPMLYPCIPK